MLSSSGRGPAVPSSEPEIVMDSPSADEGSVDIVIASNRMLSEVEVGNAVSTSLVNIKTTVVVNVSISVAFELEGVEPFVGLLSEPERVVVGESRGAFFSLAADAELSVKLVEEVSKELDDTSAVVERESTLWLGASAMVLGVTRVDPGRYQAQRGQWTAPESSSTDG